MCKFYLKLGLITGSKQEDVSVKSVRQRRQLHVQRQQQRQNRGKFWSLVSGKGELITKFKIQVNEFITCTTTADK